MPQDYTARLPPELLQHVNCGLGLADLLPLLATSRRWREIALNAPAYWQSIDLTMASAGAVNFFLTRISRTFERPFALAVRIHTEWSNLERTFPAIRTHLHHITGLDLQVHAAHASILLHALCSPASLLQMFYFVAFSVVKDVLLAEFPAELFGGYAPSLLLVSVYNVSFPEDKSVSAFQQAQRLQLGYYTGPETTVPNVFPHFPNLQQFILQGLFISLHPVFLDPSSWAAVDFVWLKLDRTAPAVELDLAPLYSVRRVCVDFPLRQHILPLFAHIRGPAKLVFSDTGDNLAVHLVDDDDSTMMRTMSKDLLESPDSFRYDLFTLPDIAHRIVAISIDCSLWDVIVGLLPELPLVDLLQVIFDDAIPSLDAIFECPQLTVLIFRSGAECRRKLFSGTFMEFAAGRLRGVCFPIEIRLVNIQLDLDTDDRVARVEDFNRFFSLIREL